MPPICRGIKRIADVGVGLRLSGAAPRNPTVEADHRHARPPRSDAGASRAITRVFFRTILLRYLDRGRARGIEVPSCPGILPGMNIKQTKTSPPAAARRCPLARRAFDGLEDTPRPRNLIAAALAAEIPPIC